MQFRGFVKSYSVKDGKDEPVIGIVINCPARGATTSSLVRLISRPVLVTIDEEQIALPGIDGEPAQEANVGTPLTNSRSRRTATIPQQ